MKKKFNWKILFLIPFFIPIGIFGFGLLLIIIGSIITAIIPKGVNVGEPLKTAKPKFVYETKYYDIRGSTADELYKQMGELGPHLSDEEKKDMIIRSDGYAMLRSEIKWKAKTAKKKSGCYLHDLDYTHNITITYPRWIKPANVSPALEERWDKFYQGIVIHEEGHKEIDLKQTDEMFPLLIKTPSYPTCEELNQKMEDVSNGLQQKYRKLGGDYDIQTKSGLLQGVELK